MPERKSELTGHVYGATYRSAYWGKTYLVTDIHPNGWVTVAWEDGSAGTHCTALGARDRRIA